MSGYGLNDLAIEVRSPAEQIIFALASVSTLALGPPSLLSNGSGVLSPVIKRGQGMTLTTHPHLVQRS
jgi:hypothetical protein